MFYTFRLLTQTHLDCGDIKRLGNTGDGGWDICVVDPYFPKPGCIVYSFGINYDFTFDDSVAETFGCEVRTFDPSMLIGDHMHQPTVYFYQLGLGAVNTVNDKGWKLETMGSIMKKLKHLNEIKLRAGQNYG
ncbi:hypothetical protein LSH36_77g03001 [Paralvinella palmiformis]|uniref:Methyltransferase domain-containing protein n=1 Tax=Paralvinella palmiformis TaxID=53620 RepID=A0AAD9NAX7_9ANNE|nr:hypothetical protein LSH36_77g03001 [Paralvinella palmiformis]